MLFINKLCLLVLYAWVFCLCVCVLLCVCVFEFVFNFAYVLRGFVCECVLSFEILIDFFTFNLFLLFSSLLSIHVFCTGPFVCVRPIAPWSLSEWVSECVCVGMLIDFSFSFNFFLLSIHLFCTEPFVCVLAQVIQAYRTLIIAFKSNVAATGAQVCIMHTLTHRTHTYKRRHTHSHQSLNEYAHIKIRFTHAFTHTHYSHFICVFYRSRTVYLVSSNDGYMCFCYRRRPQQLRVPLAPHTSQIPTSIRSLRRWDALCLCV